MSIEGYQFFYARQLSGLPMTEVYVQFDKLQGDAFARRDTLALTALAQIAHDKGWRRTCDILLDTARLIDESITRRGP